MKSLILVRASLLVARGFLIVDLIAELFVIGFDCFGKYLACGQIVV